MPTYETIFITLPNLTDEEERAAVGPLVQVVAERAQIVANDRMGRRRLAYPIKKHEDGVYTRLLYDADESVPRELERRLRISDRVIRHMTIRLEDDWAVAAKEQAVRDAEAKAAAEAAGLEAAAAAAAAPAPAGAAVGGAEAPADEDGSEDAGELDDRA